MSNKVEDLTAPLQTLYNQFYKICLLKGIECYLVDTLRTPTEQEQKLKDGVSWTKKSKHLPQPPDGKSWAFDVVPVYPRDLRKEKLWAPKDPLWAAIGLIGQGLGLKWGVWKKVKGVLVNIDPGHFECRGEINGDKK